MCQTKPLVLKVKSEEEIIKSQRKLILFKNLFLLYKVKGQVRTISSTPVAK